MPTKKTTKKVAKKAAKKVSKKATKKVAKKTSQKASAKKKLSGGFDMTSTTAAKALRQTLAASIAPNRKNPPGFRSVKDLRRQFVPFGDFIFEVLTGVRGWIPGLIYEIIGDDATGKSTLVHHLIGDLYRQNIPAYLLLSQNKILTEEWCKRAMSTDPALAEVFYDNMMVDKVYTMAEAIQYVDLFCINIRKEFPQFQSKPIAIFLDSFGFLQPPDMADGFVDYGSSKGEKKEQAKALEKVPNFGTSRLAQMWKKRLQWLLDRHNAFLVIVEDQSTEIRMDLAHLPAYMQPKEEYNRTKVGGRALNQAATIQLVLTKRSVAKEDKVDIGEKIRVATVKNLYGETRRFFDFVLRRKNYSDSEGYQQRVIDLSIPTVDEVLSKVPHFNITKVKSTGLYTSPFFGVNNGTAQDIFRIFEENAELKEWLGKSMGIYGYAKDEVPVANSSTEEEEPSLSFEEEVAACVQEGGEGSA